MSKLLYLSDCPDSTLVLPGQGDRLQLGFLLVWNSTDEKIDCSVHKEKRKVGRRGGEYSKAFLFQWEKKSVILFSFVGRTVY